MELYIHCDHIDGKLALGNRFVADFNITLASPTTHREIPKEEEQWPDHELTFSKSFCACYSCHKVYISSRRYFILYKINLSIILLYMYFTFLL